MLKRSITTTKATKPGQVTAVAAVDPDALERIYRYPIYVMLRRLGKGPATATAETTALTQRFFWGERATQRQPGLLQLQVYEWIMEDEAKLRNVTSGGSWDGKLEEKLYATECPLEMSAELLYPRVWRLSVMEEALRALAHRYEAKQQTRLFEVLLGALGGPLRSPVYTQASRELGVPDSALRVAADQLRTRYRDELKRCFSLAHGGAPTVLEEELRPLVDDKG